ncbi:type II toxin-antitoxin system VapC family toxin [Solitalea canadensis]|uniref:Putative nucleic acid-binding protein, contains PIN domain n=1 Tax=Solitalea canadensis (strain ATCC 29591 / DSM 3403 / JCM 21819 / LMG 8368 / NBRC 15130 / NCIMB 12057 / USAM 9D) TaxID=929556 RepID=H8KL11_SOLCM|nr:PIN domain-containing protein [Solitalea canadensis]AFD08828.1 putative nucleic acid-binding protein, contains PIN domain [Solitalea canadensis DSM 3403]
MKIFILHSDSSPKDCYYILDTNVWLPIFGLDEQASVHYKEFFDKILKTKQSRILLCPLQLSEILNRLLRFHAHKEYSKKYKSKTGSVPEFKNYYKEEYRKSDNFKKQYDIIIDDIEGYLSNVEIKDIAINDFDSLTKFDARKSDYNDHYIYLVAKEHNATIITHDSDFFGLNDVAVGTFNRKLYNRFKDSIKPTK